MNNQQKQAFESLRKKMNEAGVTESEFNEFIEGNSSKRNITKEQASEAYIKAKLRDSNEYLGCEESRRMTLIQSDMYTVQEAFEDGWEEAKKTLLDKVCAYLYMTREEQIKKQADIYTDNASNYAEWSDDGGWSETNDIELVEKAFIEGAKWADKTMIDKAYRWLEENIDAYSKVVIVENSIPTIVLTEDFKTNFKKAMRNE